ncbi:TolC family protein [Runella slithyformis]|uniref:Outer membrane efflux protein n=1 Tax=Runella slithyformis (strain ATCC 29530 / DSM 19594 / LMG 11500 / NCIMB 11436 / LSU 4) TaxID=761193 RepID=A0A7U3ZHB5_RUNSL|nr:TolC family protein [Runella slithyformis]AEI47137.1 outer membrane efflux protein [Runella slithyformis DSM 19594]
MKKYTLILLTLFVTQRLFSQTLTLPDAVSMALKNNLDIEVLKNNVQIADINNHISVAGGLPAVSATITDNESSTNVNQKLNTGVEIKRNGAAANQLNSNVTATMLLYNGYRVKAVKKRLEQAELQSLQFVNAQVQNTIAAVMTRYYDVIRQQAYTRTIDQSIDVAQKRLDIVKAQQSVGLANNADLFQSQIDLNTLYQTKQSQQLIIEQAKTDLLLLLNVRPDTMISIRDTIVVDRGIVLDDIMKNLNRNAELMAAEYQIRIAEQLVKETTALRYPTLRANTGFNYNRNQQAAGLTLLNQTSGPFIGLSLGIPIYNGGVFKRQEQIAGINAKNAALQKSILLRNFSNAAVRTYQAYTMNLQQLDDQKKIVDLARQLLNLALQRFQLRQATIVEVRQAQESFENAGLIMTNLSFAAKAAEIELLRLINELK